VDQEHYFVNKWLANNSFEENPIPTSLEALDLRSSQTNFGTPTSIPLSEVEILDVSEYNKPQLITNLGNFNYMQTNYDELPTATSYQINDTVDDKKNIGLDNNQVLFYRHQHDQSTLFQLPTQEQTQMTTDIHQAQTNRQIFKMNTDFWQHARGPPPLGSMPPSAVAALASNLMISTTMAPTNLSTPPVTTSSSAATGSSMSPSMSTGGNTGMVSPNSANLGIHHQLLQQQQQQQQQSENQQTAVNLIGNNNNSNNNHSGGDDLTSTGQTTAEMQLALVHHHQQQQQQQQQQQNHHNQQQQALNAQQMASQQSGSVDQPPQSLTPGGTSTPDSKMKTEKLVNEFQVSVKIMN
jgi:hypothetical protein